MKWRSIFQRKNARWPQIDEKKAYTGHKLSVRTYASGRPHSARLFETPALTRSIQPSELISFSARLIGEQSKSKKELGQQKPT
jgi:hypothetical protein